MMDGERYRTSLDDGRAVYLEGRRVAAPATEPRMADAVAWVARGYDDHHDPAPSARHPLMTGPVDVDGLRARMRWLGASDPTVNTTFSSLMTLLTVTSALDAASPYPARMTAYREHAEAADIRIAECITDGKGDRSLPPAKQADPDAYLRVVARDAQGVVVSGAKLHITGAPLVHDLLIMPTKRMKPGEEAYALCAVVPVHAPGVRVVAVTHAPRGADTRGHPVSRAHNMPDAMVIFDEVHIPYERVFCDGEVENSALFAHSLGLWERIGGTAKLAEEADRLVGLAELMARANGTHRIPHIKDKIAEMAMHATMVRAGLEAALACAERTADGHVYPSDLFTNAAKYTGAAGHSVLVRHLHDIAGGSAATVPSPADLEHPDIGALALRHLQGAAEVSAQDRARLFHTVRDLTADTFGGWQAITNIQSGGGLYAQRIVTRKHYDMDHATRLAAAAAGLS